MESPPRNGFEDRESHRAPFAPMKGSNASIIILQSRRLGKTKALDGLAIVPSRPVLTLRSSAAYTASMARRQTFVDGYNVVHRNPDLARLAERSLELARTVLVNLLNASRDLQMDDVTVVFDGGKGGLSHQTAERHGRVRIVFSRLGETADDVIKRLVASTAGEVRVITDDRDIREHTALHGGVPVHVGVRRPWPELRPPDDEEEESRPSKKGLARRPKKRRGPGEPYWTP